MIFARGRGRVGFICPHCFMINGPKVINWRRARIACTLGCKRVFRVGFAFAFRAPKAPYNGFTGQMGAGKTTNRAVEDAYAEGLSKIEAEYRGPLEFLCPVCHVPNRTPDRSTNHTDAICRSCHASYNVGVILWTDRPTYRSSPHDWVFPSV